MQRVLWTLLCSLLVVGSLAAVRIATAQPTPPVFVHVTAPAGISAAHGVATTIVLKVTIDKGYHLQGNNAKDPYVPTTASVTAPTGVTIGKIVYPPSVRKAFSGETLPVYESKVEIKIPITVSSAYKSDSIKLPVTINYQGCNETSCYPPAKLSTTIPVKVK